MKKLWAGYLLAACVVGSSCDGEVTIKGTEGEQKPVLYCFPSNLSDTTFIRFSWSKSVNGNEGINRDREGVGISFWLNGEERKVTSVVSDTQSGGSFFVLGRLEEGDDISVRVKLPDGKTVSAVTEVPSPFPLKKVRIKEVEAYGTRAVRFEVTLQDRRTTEDYYGVKVLYRYPYDGLDLDETKDPVSCTLMLNTDNEPLLNDRFGVDDVFHLSDDFYQHLYIWNDRKIDGREYTLSLDFLLDNKDALRMSEGNPLFKLVLYSLSEDLYKYLKSVNALNNNDLGKAGLAPVHKKYTKVVTGLGIVAGCNVYETDWMEASSLSE